VTYNDSHFAVTFHGTDSSAAFVLSEADTARLLSQIVEVGGQSLIDASKHGAKVKWELKHITYTGYLPSKGAV